MSVVSQAIRDPALPGLAIALEPEALRELLSRNEGSRGFEILQCSISDVQYTPDQAASILVRVKMRDNGSGRTARQRLLVRCLPQGAAPPDVPAETLERYAQRRRNKATRRLSPLESPVVIVPEASLVIYAFPIDPALPSLADVTDPGFVRQALHRAWQPRRVRVRRVDCEVLGYTPGARAALRYEVLAENKDTAVPEMRCLVGKLQLRRPPAELFAGHWALWRRTLGRAAIVPPAGYIATAGLSLQEFLPGQRLADLAGEARFNSFVRRAARSIAVVHGTHLPLLTTRTVEKECRTIRRWTDVLDRLCPQLSRPLERLRSRLTAEMGRRVQITGTVHADFHLANILADRDAATIIDWDQMAHGDPMGDVGRFLASLRVCALRVAGSPHALDDSREEFLEAYLRQRPDDERRARLFESAALLIAAASPFRLQREGWEDGAEAMVQESVALLDASTRGHRVARPAKTEATRIPRDEREAWALDPTYAQSLLVPLVQEQLGGDIEVTECHPSLIESTPDALRVRWTVKGYRECERWRGLAEGFGWSRRSGTGLLRRLTAVRSALAELPGALRLPRPLGALPPLGLVAVIPCRGQPLTTRLEKPGVRPTLERLGRGFATLASIPLPFDKVRDAGHELRVVNRRTERLLAEQRLEAARIAALAAEIERRLSVSFPLAPTIHRFDLEDFVCEGNGTALRIVRDIVQAPRHAGIGTLLALVARASMRRGEPESSQTRPLRDAYCETMGAEPAEIVPFEALALLRHASGRLLQGRPSDTRVPDLLARVERLFDE